MVPDTPIRALVEAVKGIVFDAARDTLGTGFCMAPQVHLFYEPEDEYIGYVSCRPYYRGSDAQAAIERLGIIAAATCATRMLAVWEESDLRTSLYGPADNHPNGVATLEVSLTRHEMTWWPFRVNDHGQPPGIDANFEIQWGARTAQPDVALMPAVQSLIRAWRMELIGTHGPTWVGDTVNAAVAEGYEIHTARMPSKG
jgi:hypothetical protein